VGVRSEQCKEVKKYILINRNYNFINIHNKFTKHRDVIMQSKGGKSLTPLQKIQFHGILDQM